MKNIANADRPKSAIAILPPRPFRGSGKAAQTAFKSVRSDGKSFIHIVNHFLMIWESPKSAPTATFRIAGTPFVKGLLGWCLLGWKVVRLWQHELEGDFDLSVDRIVS